MRYSVVAVVWVLCSVAYGQGLSIGSPYNPASAPPGASVQLPTAVLQVGNIIFANPKELDITLRPDQTASSSVEILSDHDSPNGIQFYLSLYRPSEATPCRAGVATLPIAPGFEKGKSRLIPIEITSCTGNEASGVLGILGSSGKPREIHIVLKRASSRWLTVALFGSLALSMTMVVICGKIVRTHGHKLTDSIGGASWNFSSSWASNIVAFGTAFSALIQLTMFPEKPAFGSRTEYAFLAAFSLALVALAPAVQQLTNQIHVDESGGTPVLTTSSSVFGFLLATVFTMSGVFLQIALQILIIVELSTAAIVNKPTTICAELCVVFGGIGLAVYCWRTILTTVAANASRTGTKSGPLRTFSVPAVDSATAATREISVL